MAQPGGNLAATLPESDEKLLRNLAHRIRIGDAPPLLRLLELKSRLKSRLGVQKAFAVYRDTICPGNGVRMRAQPLVSLLERAESDALVLHMIHDGGLDVATRTPSHVGDGLFAPPLSGRSRKVFVACLANATVQARSSAVRMADGTFAFDIQGNELGRIPVDMAFDPVVFDQAGTDLMCIDDQRATTRLRLPEALSLLGCDTVAFGHWIMEEFQKYILARQFPEVARLPVLIDADIPVQHKQSIAAFCGPDHPIIEVPRYMRVEVDRLWVANTWGYAPKLMVTDKGADPNAVVLPAKAGASFVSAAMEDLDRLHDLPPAEGAIFVTRDPERYRHISNQEEVTGMLETAGYRSVRPEELSFVEQLRAYRGASHVVVQSGSAMLGLMMCRPGTRILLLTHGIQPFAALMAHLFEELGLDLRLLVGPIVDQDTVYSDKSSYRIDPDLLAGELARLSDGTTGEVLT